MTPAGLSPTGTDTTCRDLSFRAGKACLAHRAGFAGAAQTWPRRDPGAPAVGGKTGTENCIDFT